ncbi:MAG TPA: hypothetical protein VF756_12815 [Thermoanaerobaculia bacterium]
MDRSEYERRRRALEAQRQADLELIEAGYLAKVRSLEAVWAASQAAAGVPEGTREAPSAPAAAQAPPPAPARSTRGETLDVLVDALPALPVEFDTNDLVRALGRRPPRTSFYRAIEQLIEEGTIQVSQEGSGTQTRRYRKLSAS